MQAIVSKHSLQQSTFEKHRACRACAAGHAAFGFKADSKRRHIFDLLRRGRESQHFIATHHAERLRCLAGRQRPELQGFVCGFLVAAYPL